MRKLLILLLMLTMSLLTACGPQTAVQTAATESTAAVTETETAEPTTQPETEPPIVTEEETVLADHVPAVLKFLNRGDEIDIVSDFDDENVQVKTDLGYGLISKNLIRMKEAESYETWEGYSAWNTAIFSNFYLSGEPVQKLAQNIKVMVIEDLGNCLLIEIDGKSYYTSAKQILRYPVSGGGNGSSGESSGGQDGGDITMGGILNVKFLSVITQSGEISGKAVVLADQVPVVLGYFDRGQSVPAVIDNPAAEEKEGYHLLSFDGIYAYMEDQFLRRAGEEAFEVFDGYANGMAKIYDNFYLSGDPSINTWANQKIHVLEELKDVYLVEVNDQKGYILKSGFSLNPISVAPAGGNQEWSDPVL